MKLGWCLSRARANNKKPPSKKEVPQEWVTLRPGLLTGWTLSTNQLESRTKSHTYSWGLLSWGFAYAHDTSTWQKGTGNTDTIFLSNALPVTVTGSIWQEVSVCDTGNGVNSGFLFFMCFSRARNHHLNPTHQKEQTFGFKFLIHD